MKFKFLVGVLVVACPVLSFGANETDYQNHIKCAANSYIVLETAVPARAIPDKEAKGYIYQSILNLSLALKDHSEDQVKNDYLQSKSDIYATKIKYGITDLNLFNSQQLLAFINHSVQASDKYCVPYIPEIKEMMTKKYPKDSLEEKELLNRIEKATKIIMPKKATQ